MIEERLCLLTTQDPAYLLVSAATTLLRAAIESPPEAKVQCVQTLLALLRRLTAARDWDIGDFCLQRCKPSIDKLAAKLGVRESNDDHSIEQAGVATHEPQQGMSDPTLSVESDLLLPLDSLDYQFDLFDDFAGFLAANV